MECKQELGDYLRQAAALEGITLSESQLDRLRVVFGRNLELASRITSFALDESDEIAPAFRP